MLKIFIEKFYIIFKIFDTFTKQQKEPKLDIED